MFVKNPEYFLTIAKERSISKAAERLYLSQPYLSQYLAKLEHSLGVILLDRSHTPLTLTPAGELFHAYLERQGYLERQLVSDLQDLKNKSVPFSTSVSLPGAAASFCPMSCPPLPNCIPMFRWSFTRFPSPICWIWLPTARWISASCMSPPT